MDTPNLNECYLYFALTGHGFDPDAVSAALNLAPTRAVYEGSSMPAGNTAHPCCAAMTCSA
ncbi:Uncharacterised protein [Helicobacter pametensis]|nr:Uncharacterised protein [Helicobacter pametensis]